MSNSEKKPSSSSKPNKMAISKKVIFAILTVIVLLIVAFIGFFRYTKSFSPSETLKYKENGLEVEVTYCRPSKKGREIFGSLVPFNKVWRTGANEATSFTVNQALYFGNQMLKEGKYSLFTIPQQDKWTVIFNRQTGQWGTQYDESQDVLRIDTSEIERSENEEEQFTILVEEEAGVPKLVFHWDRTKVKLPLKQNRF